MYVDSQIKFENISDIWTISANTNVSPGWNMLPAEVCQDLEQLVGAWIWQSGTLLTCPAPVTAGRVVSGVRAVVNRQIYACIKLDFIYRAHRCNKFCDWDFCCYYQPLNDACTLLFQLEVRLLVYCWRGSWGLRRGCCNIDLFWWRGCNSLRWDRRGPDSSRVVHLACLTIDSTGWCWHILAGMLTRWLPRNAVNLRILEEADQGEHSRALFGLCGGDSGGWKHYRFVSVVWS